MNKMLVPIYLADVLIGKYKVSGKSKTKIDEVIKQKVLVKGFTIQDCINRRGNRILNEITSKEKNVVLEIENLTLISQHGLGVND